ncbi:MAG: Wzz/FepE/Etk N-terminal domain-containing protein [Parcubacteria group bacterium]
MELKEYLNILKTHIKAFILAVVLVVIAGIAYLIFRPVSFDTSLTLNITRSGTQATADYKYDDFYRLQADEKFAETVVEWLKSPRTVSDIYASSDINASQFSLGKMEKSLRSEKLSSQIVSVKFSADTPEKAKKISDSISKVIAKNIVSLNVNQKEENWFEVVAQDPVIAQSRLDFWVVILAALAIGIFMGLWAVLVIHYLK